MPKNAFEIMFKIFKDFMKQCNACFIASKFVDSQKLKFSKKKFSRNCKTVKFLFQVTQNSSQT